MLTFEHSVYRKKPGKSIPGPLNVLFNFLKGLSAQIVLDAADEELKEVKYAYKTN